MSYQDNPLRRDMMLAGRAYESVGLSMLNLVRRVLTVSRADNALYTEGHLNNCLLLGGIFNANTAGCIESARLARREVGRFREAAGGLEVPSGEWARLELARIPEGCSAGAFRDEVHRTLARLRELGQDPLEWDLAIDMHLIPRYDKRHGAELVRARAKKGADKFERYITVQSVTPGARLVMAVLPMPALERTEDYVRMLLAACRDMGVNVGTVMADREFFSTRVLQTFVDMNIKYLVPCRNTPAVVDAIGEFAEGGRGAISDMHITDAGGNRVPYAAVITERKKRRKKGSSYKDADLDRFDHEPGEPPHRKYIAFATNDPGIDVDEYARRWGIETGYRMIESARPRTRSKSPEVRAFCFVYAVLMYNAWVVLNMTRAARGARPAAGHGVPSLTQRDMTMCILFLIMFEIPRPERRQKPPPLPAA